MVSSLFKVSVVGRIELGSDTVFSKLKLVCVSSRNEDWERSPSKVESSPREPKKD